MNGNLRSLEQIRIQLEKERQKVRIYEEQLEIIVASTIEGLAFHDNAVLLFANDAFYNMFGYTPEELDGRNLLTEPQLVADESVETVKQHMTNGDESPYFVVNQHKDGHKFNSVVVGRNKTYQGKAIRCTTIVPFPDVT